MEVQGALELPAEANPLTEGLLFHVLRSAASSDPHQIQTGTKQLQKWEAEKGYYPLLQVCAFPSAALPLLSMLHPQQAKSLYPCHPPWDMAPIKALTCMHKVKADTIARLLS